MTTCACIDDCLCALQAASGSGHTSSNKIDYDFFKNYFSHLDVKIQEVYPLMGDSEWKHVHNCSWLQTLTLPCMEVPTSPVHLASLPLVQPLPVLLKPLKSPEYSCSNANVASTLKVWPAMWNHFLLL